MYKKHHLQICKCFIKEGGYQICIVTYQKWFPMLNIEYVSCHVLLMIEIKMIEYRLIFERRYDIEKYHTDVWTSVWYWKKSEKRVMPKDLLNHLSSQENHFCILQWEYGDPWLGVISKYVPLFSNLGSNQYIPPAFGRRYVLDPKFSKIGTYLLILVWIKRGWKWDNTVTPGEELSVNTDRFLRNFGPIHTDGRRPEVCID